MPTKIFYADEAQNDPITLKWGLFWKDFTITKNGELIGQLNGTKELEKGASFPLPSGQLLSVQLARKFFFSQGLNVLIDGQVLPGSHTHPQEQFKQGYYALLLITVLHVCFGLVAMLPGLEALQEIGIGLGTVLTGMVYAGLAYWAKVKISPLAFQIALALFVLDFLMGIVMSAGNGPNPVGGMLFRLFIGVVLFAGAQGAKALRSQPAVTIAE